MTIALLLALNPVPALPAQDTEQMRVRPSTEAEAVAEFEATCVSGLYDVDKLKRGAAASRRGYSFTDAPPASWRTWISAYGSIHYLQAASDAPRCNMTSFTRAAVDRKALDTALRAMAKRQSARGYAELRNNDGLSWSWYNFSNQPMTVQVSLDRRTPQQIILMLKPVAVSRTN